MGLFREYIGRPSHDPDKFLSIDDLSDIRRANSDSDGENDPPAGAGVLDIPPWFAPCPNASTFRILDWSGNGNTTKSIEEVQKLVDNVICAPDFDPADLLGVNLKRESVRLDEPTEPVEQGSLSVSIDDPLGLTSHSGTGWTHTSVPIPIPDGQKHDSWDDITYFNVKGLAVRRIIPIVQEISATRRPRSSTSRRTDISGNRTKVVPQTRTRRDVHHRYIHQSTRRSEFLPREPGDTYERVVVALMLYSDSTRLAQFGSASLWPLYLYFGNQSKYARECPTEYACHHLAYLPKVNLVYFESIAN